MSPMSIAVSALLAAGFVACFETKNPEPKPNPEPEACAREAACSPRGTCSGTTTRSCAYDKNCPQGEACRWTRSCARFADNGDGTVTDWQTCLTWEKKTGIFTGGAFCCSDASVYGCDDPHGVNNKYTWSTGTSYVFDGSVAMVFLKQLNDAAFAGHSDWRLPTSAGDPGYPVGDPELESILSSTYMECTSTPCIDPIFGPTSILDYWSSSTTSGVPPAFVWVVNFQSGDGLRFDEKRDCQSARAVRPVQ